jgi:hypothetical protein
VEVRVAEVLVYDDALQRKIDRLGLKLGDRLRNHVPVMMGRKSP